MKCDCVRRLRTGVLVLAVSVAAWSLDGLGQTAGEATNREIREASAALLRQMQGAEVRDRQGNELIAATTAAIEALGDKGAAVVREALRTAPSAERRHIAYALGRSHGGQPVGGLLLEMSTGDPDPDVRGVARWFFLQGVLQRPVTTNELRVLIQGVETDPTAMAGGWARACASCAGLTAEQRREATRAIVARFAKEAAAPSDPKKQGAPYGTYVTQEAFELNQYTLALRNLKDPSAVEFLQEHLKNAGDNARLRKRLVIALGISGYAPLGPELKAILENDPDVSTRAHALRAYAAAVGPAAIPVLEAYTNDTTTLFPGGGGGNPMRTKYPLQIVARDELSRLRTARQ